MKIFKRVLTVLIAIIVLALAAGMIYLNGLKTRAVPDYNETVDLENLTDKVTVYRDSFGIPHIYATNEPDLYRTTGYVMAQDRLWQMDLLRRITVGRLSEVLDPGLVNADQLFRALSFTEKSKLVLSKTDPEILACIEAFSDGVNQFIEQNRKNLSFEFALLGYEPDLWEPIHTVNLIGYMAWDLASGWGTEIALYKMQQVLEDTLFQELLPNMKYQSTPVFPEFMTANDDLELQSCMDDAIGIVKELGLQIFEASNNWAVSGTKSETGMPFMVNDIHLGLMAPGIWYQMHQVVEGEFNVTGVALPGAPYVIAGHNDDIAWGMTNVTVDDIDFYLETINPEDSNQYMLDGQWMDMKVVVEEIMVKGMDEPEIRVNKYTHRGPVISEFRGVDDRVLSVRWQGNEFSNELRSVHLLNRAGNWDEFRNAVSTFNSVSQNIVYADRFGNIGLQTSAGIPIRREGGILVYPGDTSLFDWLGQVPFEELPYSFNPENGYVSSANNRTVGDDYPYYIGTWYSLPNRVERIREMLDEKEILGTDDFKRMLRDHTSHFARKMTPVYLEALKDNTEGVYQSAHQILEQWDYNLEVTSSAALIYEILWLELNKAMFLDELGEELYPLMLDNNIISRNLINRVRVTGESRWCDDVNTEDKKESFHDNIRTAFSQAVDTIASMYGTDPALWQWGDLHKVALIHPLGSVGILDKLFKINRGPFPVGGSFHTVCPYSYPLGNSYVADHGASERHIFNTADWDASLTVIPTGTSGVPASPHYLDQTELYVNNKFHRDHFSREAVETNMKYKAVFE
ncbi:MAG: penicillin acylase family protein [Bacteroidales bacterium]|nr:penicillin acylase family protein [Bacteroidales bacterium]